MKKRLMVAMLLMTLVLMCGCGSKENSYTHQVSDKSEATLSISSKDYTINDIKDGDGFSINDKDGKLKALGYFVDQSYEDFVLTSKSKVETAIEETEDSVLWGNANQYKYAKKVNDTTTVYLTSTGDVETFKEIIKTLTVKK